MEKGKKGALLSLSLFFCLVIFVFLFFTNLFMSCETRCTLIDGNEIISYEVIDGSHIIITTNNESYEIKLYDDVVDFTVSSDIYIELTRYYSRTFFWEEFEPSYDTYFINRIIKIPTEES